MLVSLNWLKEYLGDDSLSAKEVETLLTFHAFEIEGVESKGDDQIIDVDILPNRSSDCLSHRGVARELATLFDKPLAKDPLATQPELNQSNEIEVDIESSEDCPRFTASLVKGVKVHESPEWLKKRLESVGVRSINNIVDATNYVMLAIGQPIHAYDADKFPQTDGKWKFGVRRAKGGEVVKLLAEGGKDEERNLELSGGELLIVDRSSMTPVGLAGVKGGRFAEVDDKTRNIIIEAAHFNPNLTRKTARGHGIVIDASKRFENEPARDLPTYAQKEIVDLIVEIVGGEFTGWVDEYLEQSTPERVSVLPERVNGLLGVKLDTEEMKSILARAGIVVEQDGDFLVCQGPWERTDLKIEEDFIEEIGRIYGYQHVESVVPEKVLLPEINKRHYYSEKIREVLIGLGYSEVVTSSFRKKDQIQLRNALAKDKSYLRSSLGKNLSEVLDKNATHADLLGNPDTRVFEIGSVFASHEGGVSEHQSLAVGVRVKSSGYSGKEDKVLVEATGALSKELGLKLSEDSSQGVWEVSLTELLADLPDPTEYEKVEVTPAITYKPFSLYPAVSRDISLWVEAGTTAKDVEKVLQENAGNLCVRITLFDEFSKDNKTSYAFRLVFQSDNKTLTDIEVNKDMDKVYAAVAELNWEVR